MSDWKNREDRKEATWRLLQKLDADPALRQACLNEPDKAKETLQACGEFTNMPADVELRLLEGNETAQEKLAIIVLPPVGEMPERAGFEGDEYWRCSWLIWEQ